MLTMVHWYNGTMYIVLLLALVTFSIVFNCIVVQVYVNKVGKYM